MVTYSMHELYALASAEGEGYGTAYEYLIKLRFLDDFLKGKKIKTVLIYGLPQKYGLSLDFLYYCTKHGLQACVYTDKAKSRQLRSVLKNVSLVKPKGVTKTSRKFDLVLSCEYLQQLSAPERKRFTALTNSSCSYAVIFVPNKENKSHRKHSKLNGLSVAELQHLFQNSVFSGFVDIPFFPPGVGLRRTKKPSRFLLLLLVLWSYIENVLHGRVRRRYAHICYVTVDNTVRD